MDRPALALLRLWAWFTARIDDDRRRDRGDVPGWVMVTILSAVLVVTILAFAKQPLQDLFTHATDQVKNAH